MNKDKSPYFAIIGYSVAIIALVVFALFLAPVTYPEDFMTMPEKPQFPIIIVIIVVFWVLYAFYKARTEEEIKNE